MNPAFPEDTHWIYELRDCSWSLNLLVAKWHIYLNKGYENYLSASDWEHLDVEDPFIPGKF